MKAILRNHIGELSTLAVGVSVGSTAVMLGGSYWWCAFVPLLLPVLYLVITRCPVVLIVALSFVGMLKKNPAAELSLTDPTLIVLISCGAVTAMTALLALSGARPPRLSDRLREQVPTIVAYFAFVAVAAASIMYTVAPEAGGAKILRLLVISTLLFIAPSVLITTEREVWQFVSVSALFSIFIAGRTLLRIAHLDTTITDITAIDESQAIGASLLAISFSPLPYRNAWLVRCSAISILATGMLAGAARGPLFSVAVAAAIGWLMTKNSAHRPRQLALAAGVAIFVVAAASFTLQILSKKSQRYEQKIVELRQMATGNWRTGASGGQRLELYQQALDAFIERPLIGWGVGGWAVVRYGYDYRPQSAVFHSMYPHNIILETAVEEGLVGLFFLSLLFARIAGTIRRMIMQARQRYGFLMPVCVYCTLICMFSNDINNRILWTWLGVTVAVGGIRSRKQTSLGENSVIRNSTWTLRNGVATQPL